MHLRNGLSSGMKMELEADLVYDDVRYVSELVSGPQASEDNTGSTEEELGLVAF